VTRSLWVRLHRWAGLTMAGFLILVGLTGSLLAFLPELNHWLSPRLYPGAHGDAQLDAATLARRAEALLSNARVARVFLDTPGTAIVGLEAKPNTPAVDFSLYLDTATGTELGRVTNGGLPVSIDALLPFLFRIHWSLALGETGTWILGLVALTWTIDSFVAFYLTLPARGASAGKRFLTRWKPAWIIKRRGSFYRINFDLHRAGGLWLSVMLLIFAWSSVCFNLNSVYRAVTQLAFDLETPIWQKAAPPAPPADKQPIAWEEAQSIAAKIMDDLAAARGFHVDRVVSLSLERERGFYAYDVHSSLDPGEKYGSTSVYVDAYTGALRDVHLPTGLRAGDTMTTWLVELHTANVFGLAYRIFVCALGLAIVMLSVTGVYIWWKKRSARAHHGIRETQLQTPALSDGERSTSPLET